MLKIFFFLLSNTDHIKNNFSTNDNVLGYRIIQPITLCFITISNKDAFSTLLVQFSAISAEAINAYATQPKNFKQLTLGLQFHQASKGVMLRIAFVGEMLRR